MEFNYESSAFSQLESHSKIRNSVIIRCYNSYNLLEPQFTANEVTSSVSFMILLLEWIPIKIKSFGKKEIVARKSQPLSPHRPGIQIKNVLSHDVRSIYLIQLFILHKIDFLFVFFILTESAIITNNYFFHSSNANLAYYFVVDCINGSQWCNQSIRQGNHWFALDQRLLNSPSSHFSACSANIQVLLIKG